MRPITVLAGSLDVPVAVEHDTWHQHVAVRHPEVMPYFDHVIATIEQPEMVARDGRHRERVYFYRRRPDVPDFPAGWLQVQVLLPEGAKMARFLRARPAAPSAERTCR